MAFSWRCPYCHHHSIITEDNSTGGETFFNKGNKDGPLAVLTHVIVCPNRECKEYAIKVELVRVTTDKERRYGKTLDTWHLRPGSRVKPLPDYIPIAIAQDYAEACAICDLSPKASATLSRRCLQGMIRDFFKLPHLRNLAAEIQAIREQVAEDTWESIEAVRTIGNIGAHMEREIDVIVDVEPDEAGLLIGLIESLIEDWYVARHNRQVRNAQIKATAAEKQAARRVTPGG
ncbi:DUF4145 domain-containing protein [Bordetella genomosp. 11]|uniref:DUF4145 domain-containing protein n=1 Tax=Bordetella genomosp. 11 TaxID=1416808 RepID=A0A261UYW1_9BORD|nr:DUF4145 domain-containing protein [Bordetella genomosp. 11]OZI67059.1 hypothetical protein CAL28_05005 [Bordetella genomosp. 11]